MLIGSRHAPLLAVSIHSLRQHYDGPIAILVGDDTGERYAQKITEARTIRFSFEGGQRGSVYAAKIKMFDLSPFDRTVFLDADTVVCGDFSEMCPEGNEVKLTQFSDWKTTGKRMTGRLLGWKDACPLLVARAVGNSYPAINTGVIGFSKGSGKFFKAWRETCAKNISFICDELAAQLVYPDFQHRVMPERLNFCPIHSRTEDARIIHFHGGCQKVHQKPEYRKLWRPAWEQAAAERFAGVDEWGPEIDPMLREVAHAG